jgi:hypothetical protein
VALYPSLALALLKGKETAAGRVWLLLRYLDREGRGWLAAAEVRAALAGPESPLRICGRRQLRTLLEKGDGRFWQRDKQRIWLRSLPKVADALAAGRFSGSRVELPLAVLLAPIGDFRAHLYATFHSSRASTGSAGGSQGGPVARAALQELSGAGRRTQQAYEKRAGVRVRPNFAIGERAGPDALQEWGWEKGTAVFVFRDYKGRHGRAGAEYVAWQLPNSYEGPHPLRSKSGRRYLNRQLADLRMRRDTGNGRETEMDDGRTGPERLYFKDGAGAAKAFNRNPAQGIYWRGRPGMWYWLGNRAG